MTEDDTEEILTAIVNVEQTFKGNEKLVRDLE